MQAGKHQFSESEKIAALIFLLQFYTHFWPASTLLRGHLALATLVSSCDRSSNFGALGLRWWGSLAQIFPSDGFWSRMLAWRTTAFVNRTHRIGFSMFVLFRKIDEDFGGSISWNTQPNWRVFLNIATALWSPFFKKPFARAAVHDPGDAHKSTFPDTCIHSRTCGASILKECHFSQNELVQVPLR